MSNEKGTTRDVIEIMIEFGGYPLILKDTAGLRKTKSDSEKQGIELSENSFLQSDISLVIFDINQILSKKKKNFFTNFENFEKNVKLDFFTSQILINNSHLIDNILFVINKCDSPDFSSLDENGLKGIKDSIQKKISSDFRFLTEKKKNFSVCFISCKENSIEELKQNLEKLVIKFFKENTTEKPFLTSYRQKVLIENAYNDLLLFFENQNRIEIASLYLRSVLGHLSRLTGNVGVEDVMDQIFKDFCIGK